MFTNFFYTLRKRKVPVSITEWVALMEALSRGFAFSSLNAFYYLARSILVKSEAYFDQYDLAFEEYFHGIETTKEIRDEILGWLKNPINRIHLTEEEIAELKSMNFDDLMETFEQRMREQKGRHDGGDKWIGTGGTSPFGHSGINPAGIRVGGRSMNRSAIQVAQERRFRNYRSDVVLDVRHFQIALKRLRRLSRIGPEDELNLDATIDHTCKNAGDIELIWTRSRKNAVKLLLLMDVGGSMSPYARLCSRLFSAAHSATHFKDFKYFYFHNCIYDNLFKDIERRKPTSTTHLLRTMESDYKVIFLGDACMAREELAMKYGAIYYYERNEIPGIIWLQRISDHFKDVVWLNPEDVSQWSHPTIKMIGRIFPMFGLTLDGLDAAISKLIARY